MANALTNALRAALLLASARNFIAEKGRFKYNAYLIAKPLV